MIIHIQYHSIQKDSRQIKKRLPVNHTVYPCLPTAYLYIFYAAMDPEGRCFLGKHCTCVELHHSSVSAPPNAVYRLSKKKYLSFDHLIRQHLQMML